MQKKVEQAFLDAVNGNNKTELERLNASPNFEQRFAIYFTSIIATHQSALYKIFKPLEILLGKEAFQELCYRYAIDNLSKNFNLNSYGHDFHQFAITAPYANNFPYLSDFIEFCYLWQQVFLDPEPGVIQIESDYPVYEIWERCQVEFSGSKIIDNWQGPFSYRIFRKDGKVLVLVDT